MDMPKSFTYSLKAIIVPLCEVQICCNFEYQISILIVVISYWNLKNFFTKVIFLLSPNLVFYYVLGKIHLLIDT